MSLIVPSGFTKENFEAQVLNDPEFKYANPDEKAIEVRHGLIKAHEIYVFDAETKIKFQILTGHDRRNWILIWDDDIAIINVYNNFSEWKATDTKNGTLCAFIRFLEKENFPPPALLPRWIRVESFHKRVEMNDHNADEDNTDDDNTDDDNATADAYMESCQHIISNN